MVQTAAWSVLAGVGGGAQGKVCAHIGLLHQGTLDLLSLVLLCTLDGWMGWATPARAVEFK